MLMQKKNAHNHSMVSVGVSWESKFSPTSSTREALGLWIIPYSSRQLRCLLINGQM